MIIFVSIVGIYCLALIMMTMIFFASKLLDRGVEELWNKFVLSFKYGIIATTIGLTALGCVAGLQFLVTTITNS